jgi:hypothetical protein
MHGSINLIIKELNINYAHDRIKWTIVHKFYFSRKAEDS